MIWSNKNEENSYWLQELEQIVDGHHPAIQRSTVRSKNWISEPTKLVTDADYIRCINIPRNTIMTKQRLARTYQTGPAWCMLDAA